MIAQIDIHFVFEAMIAIVAFVFAAWELRKRRELTNAEIELQQQRLELEREDRVSRQDYVRTMASTAQLLGDEISAHLQRHPGWAVEALERAKMHPIGDSVYALRTGHYAEEKQFLTEHFSNLLLARCKKHVEEGRFVAVLVDSGSTLAPLLERLSHEATRIRQLEEKWIREDNLRIYTNNLAGTISMMEGGRLTSSRYSPLAFDARIFPGVPLPTYAAVLGADTNEAVSMVRDRIAREIDGAARPVVIIGIVTGNWIRVRQTRIPCAIPMARGSEHTSFKQAVIDISDEVYVVAPLGKIFLRSSVMPDGTVISSVQALKRINQAFGYTPNASDRSLLDYEQVNIDDHKAKITKLITTIRPISENYILNPMSRILEHSFEPPTPEDGVDKHESPGIISEVNVEKFANAEISTMPHVALPFFRLPDVKLLQIEAEFPHPPTQKPEFMREFFFVDP